MPQANLTKYKPKCTWQALDAQSRAHVTALCAVPQGSLKCSSSKINALCFLGKSMCLVGIIDQRYSRKSRGSKTKSSNMQHKNEVKWVQEKENHFFLLQHLLESNEHCSYVSKHFNTKSILVWISPWELRADRPTSGRYRPQLRCTQLILSGAQTHTVPSDVESLCRAAAHVEHQHETQAEIHLLTHFSWPQPTNQSVWV